MTRSRISNLKAILWTGVFAFGPMILSAKAQPFLFTALNSDISRLSYGSVSLADVNGDGRYDVLYTGNQESSMPFGPTSGIALTRIPGPTDLYRMNFDLVPLSTESWLGKASWIDVDLDGDLDFLLTGTQSEEAPYQSMSVLYRAGDDWVAEDVGIVGVHSSVVRWADYDNDGDSDLLLMGRTSNHDHTVRLYRNDAGQSFTEVSTPFPQIAFGDAQWGDFDNDNDFDLLLSGIGEKGEFITQLYRNDGESGFTATNQLLRPLGFSAAAWGDYDADGDMDLVLSGAHLGVLEVFEGETVLYRNNGGTLTEVVNSFYETFYGGLSWADHDLDGDLDLFVMGRTSMSGNHIGMIYENSEGTFTAVTGLVGTSTSNAEWGDVDGDLDADVVVSGVNLQGIPFTKFYRNDSRLTNTVPSAPTGLSASVAASDVVLQWNPSQDEESRSAGLTYAVRVGTSPGVSDVMSAYASVETGFRIVPGFGNVGSGTSWSLRDLPAGIYYWNVQAVDNSLVGSPFSEEGQFTVVTGGKISTETESEQVLPDRIALHPVYPNPARDHVSISFDLPKTATVQVQVYDLLGKRMNILVDEVRRAGTHTIEWDGRTDRGDDLVSGVYFVRMKSGDRIQTRKLVVLK